nr:uncharacterized protein LOC127293217 isoform X2 [Lolium perenne]
MCSSLGGDAGSSCGDTSSRSLPRWCRVDAASGDGGGCRSHPWPSIWEDVQYYRARKASSTPATWMWCHLCGLPGILYQRKECSFFSLLHNYAWGLLSHFFKEEHFLKSQDGVALYCIHLLFDFGTISEYKDVI